MGHQENQQEEQVDSLDIDKPGYYTPILEEFFRGLEYEYLVGGKWSLNTCWLPEDGYGTDSYRIKYLQAKDIAELGFGRVAQGIAMYQRGRVAISTYRLLDPTYAKIKVMINSIPIFEGRVKNKSELRRILKLNEINFVES